MKKILIGVIIGLTIASLFVMGSNRLQVESNLTIEGAVEPRPCVELTVPSELTDTIPQYSHIKDKMLPPGTYTYTTKNGGGYRDIFVDLAYQIYELITTDLHFERISSWEDADIRMMLDDPGGSRAYTGTDIFIITGNSKTEPTIWIGSYIYHSYDLYVLLHEIGHNLGLDHEHPNQTNGIKWNKEKLHAEVFSQPPYNWTWERSLDWFAGHDPEKYELSEFDENSMWLYYYHCKYTLDGRGCGKLNYFFSQGDIEGLQSDYGNPFLY